MPIYIMDDSLSYTCNNVCILFLIYENSYFTLNVTEGEGGGAKLFSLSLVASVFFFHLHFDDLDFGYSTIEHSLPRLPIPSTCLYLHALHV